MIIKMFVRAVWLNKKQQQGTNQERQQSCYHCDFFEEEYIIRTTILTTTTTTRQKTISFLLVSCWYSLACPRSSLPSLKLFFILLIVVAAICSFMPCCRIMLPVSRAILCILLTRTSIWSSSCCFYSSSLRRSWSLLLARIWPESCCSLMLLMATVFYMLAAEARSFFINYSFFWSSSGWWVSMKSLFICLMRSRREDCSSISTSDFCSSLQQRFSFSYSASSCPKRRMLVQARISVFSLRNFSIEALIDPPSFSNLRSLSPMLMEFFISMKVGLFLLSCSMLIINLQIINIQRQLPRKAMIIQEPLRIQQMTRNAKKVDFVVLAALCFFLTWSSKSVGSFYFIGEMSTAERKAVIKHADMNEEMQQDAIDCANVALEKFNIEKDIAAYIKKEFDKKYNPTWHCVVGRNFGSYVTHETKHFIYFYMGQVAVLLFKSG